MDSPGANRLLVVSEEQFENVRRSYGATADSIREDVTAVAEWFATQPHLPHLTLDREWVERLLVFNKMSVERVKERLDMIFTTRNTMPKFFRNRNPSLSFKIGILSVSVVPLPQLSYDNTRVMICKFHTSSTEFYDFKELLNGIFMINEYRQYFDYSTGDRYVCDVRNLTFKHVYKTSPSDVIKSDYINRNVFGYRVAGIHIISSSLAVRAAVALLKMLLSDKLANRISVHDTVREIHDIVSDEILPLDYGGGEKPLHDIIDDWQMELCSLRRVRWFKQLEKLRSDESKRISTKP